MQNLYCPLCGRWLSEFGGMENPPPFIRLRLKCPSCHASLTYERNIDDLLVRMACNSEQKSVK